VKVSTSVWCKVKVTRTLTLFMLSTRCFIMYHLCYLCKSAIQKCVSTFISSPPRFPKEHCVLEGPQALPFIHLVRTRVHEDEYGAMVE
jgi:hypothetical protein